MKKINCDNVIEDRTDIFVRIKDWKLFQQELADNVDDLSYLSADIKQIMESSDELHKEMASSRMYIDRVTSIIVNLYIGKHPIFRR